MKTLLSWKVAALAGLMFNLQMEAGRAEDLLAIVDVASQDQIEAMIKADPKAIEARNADGNQALHLAARWGRGEVLKLLVEAGAEVNGKGAGGATPLHFAARSSVEMCRFLLERGADPKAVNEAGKTPAEVALTSDMRGLITSFKPPAKGLVELLQAVEKGDQAAAEAIANQNPKVVTAADTAGDTALIRAVRAGQDELAHWLITQGADVNAINKAQRTALHEACETENLALVQALLKAGAKANPHPRQPLPKLDERLLGKDITNLPPEVAHLMPAALPLTPLLIVTRMTSNERNEELEQRQHENLKDLRLAESLKKNETDTGRLAERTAGIIAMMEGLAEMMPPDLPEPRRQTRLKIMEVLLEHGADLNQHGGPLWESPLGVAATNRTAEALDLLLRHGADPRQPVFGIPPLAFAMALKQEEKVKVLLKAGARPTDAGLSMPECTALSVAAAVNLETTQFLLDQAKPTGPEVAKSGALAVAAGRGLPAMLKVLLDVEPPAPLAEQGVRPLQAAVTAGSAECVKLLLDAGAPLEGRDHAGFTPLLDAIESGRTEVVALLIERGANVNAAEEDGVTVASMAARSGNVEIMDALLKAGAKTGVSGTGLDPLMVAATMGDVKMVERLLAAGMKPTVLATNSGSTALHYAAIGGSMDWNQRPAGAPPQAKRLRAAANTRGEAEWVKVVDLLMAAGANVDARVKGTLATPLMIAAKLGKAEVLSALLRYQPKLDALGNTGNTALTLAANDGQLETARRLLAAGAAIDGGPAEAPSPLWLAVQQGHKELAKFLVEKGADVRKLRGSGQQVATPLHLAAVVGDVESAKLMLAAGAAVDARDGEKLTPLIIAVFNHREAMAKFLIAEGADVNAVGRNGITPLKVAQNPKLRALLLQEGAKDL